MLGPLASARPCPGVAPRAAARRGDGDPVSWRLLDEQLAGIGKRVGRRGPAWLWDPSRAAVRVMADVEAQTARGADVGRADVREPAWLRDERWGLSPVELRLVAALVCVYEAGWGGLYDCQSTIAADLRLGTERTLRNLLWGQKWTKKNGEVGRRPGLVERGLVDVVETWRPGQRDDGRPSDQHWNLYRVGPALELAAAVNTIAKDWTNRAPRGSGWGRRAARRALGALRRGSARERYAVAGREWRRRPGREIDDMTDELDVDPPSSSSTEENPTSVRIGTEPTLDLTDEAELVDEDLVDLADVATAWEALRSKLETAELAAAPITAEDRAAARAELVARRAELLAVWPAEHDEPADRGVAVDELELAGLGWGEGPDGPSTEKPGVRGSTPVAPEPVTRGPVVSVCNWAEGSADDPASRVPLRGPRVNGSGATGVDPRTPGFSVDGPSGPSPQPRPASSSSSTATPRSAGGPRPAEGVRAVPPGTRGPPRPTQGLEGARRSARGRGSASDPPEARRWLDQLDDDDPLAAALLELLATRKN